MCLGLYYIASPLILDISRSDTDKEVLNRQAGQ
jgi:hypothetical protein